MSTALETSMHPEALQWGAKVLDSISNGDKLDCVLNEIERWVEAQISVGQCFIRQPMAQCAAEQLDSLIFPIKGSGYQLCIHFVEGLENSGKYDRVAVFAASLAGLAIRQEKLVAQVRMERRRDSLTGLLNRRSFLEELEILIRRARVQSSEITVVFVGLDRFQQVNDLYGYSAGDELLVEVGRRLRGQLVEGELAARVGGDEFALVLTSPQNITESEAAGLPIIDALRRPHLLNGQELGVTASCGISVFPGHSSLPHELLLTAGKAMANVKRHGGNHVQVFAPGRHRPVADRMHLEHGLERALANDEFQLVYQPLVDMQGQLAGVETLLSWNHPQRGRISPKDFIPVAEETGLIVPIGSWVLRQACMQGARWLQAFHATGISISVNVSALQFGRVDFVDSVAEALATSGFPPNRLELEVTESFVMEDIEAASPCMAALRKLGIRIAIDDFGTGYSSLSYLSRLPVDSLKIDQSFVRNIQDPSGSLPVVQSIVRLAHNLNLKVVAEGVETLAELDLLRLLGCDQVQGYLYGPARDERGVERMLRQPFVERVV